MDDRTLIGFLLALLSNLFIGCSFILTKKGLIASSSNDGSMTSATAYLKSPLWWMGLLSLGLGELSNFTAYIYAPAILVTPLGAVSVIISAVLASVFLKERLSTLGKLGCMQSLVGSVLIVLNAPEEKKVEKIEDFVQAVLTPGFLSYFIFVIVFCTIMILKVAPVYGRRNILVYISICSLVGSISVMSCKFLGTSIEVTANGNNAFVNAAPYVSIFVIVASIVTQMNYLNKALDTFSTAVVTPIYYVFFSTSTIVASVLLFQGFENSTAITIISVLCGFLVIFFGVFLLSYDQVEGRRSSIHSIPASFAPVGMHDPDLEGDVRSISIAAGTSGEKTGRTILSPLNVGMISSISSFGGNRQAASSEKEKMLDYPTVEESPNGTRTHSRPYSPARISIGTIFSGGGGGGKKDHTSEDREHLVTSAVDEEIIIAAPRPTTILSEEKTSSFHHYD